MTCGGALALEDGSPIRWDQNPALHDFSPSLGPQKGWSDLPGGLQCQGWNSEISGLAHILSLLHKVLNYTKKTSFCKTLRTCPWQQKKCKDFHCDPKLTNHMIPGNTVCMILFLSMQVECIHLQIVKSHIAKWKLRQRGLSDNA